MTSEEKLNLQQKATKIRLGVLEGVFNAKSGHPGGSLSASDIFAYLYFKELNIDPKKPRDPDRDRFVLSKGHCAPGLYAALALRGYFPQTEISKLRHIGSFLQGHPDMKHTPGVDMSTGSLGQGISAACGMALAGKIDNKEYRVYTLLGDGEIDEGEVWEAAMFASHRKLDNLCVIVDNNSLQIDGPISEVAGPEPIEDKFKAFGFETIKINGNDFDELEKAFNLAKTVKGKPFAIIAKTVKGKGISYMENQVGWHGKAPNEEQYVQGKKELEQQLSDIDNQMTVKG
jgi:transketolase